jgi:hypothetical protein
MFGAKTMFRLSIWAGVAVTFAQQEFFEGQLIYRVQLNDVQFNSALTDADFDNSKL